jgi:superfamily II DNA or RNA helicase
MVSEGDRVQLPGEARFVTVDAAIAKAAGLQLYVLDDSGLTRRVDLSAEEVDRVRILVPDGSAASERVLAGMWTRWMSAAATNAESTLLASTTLEPYAHQATAVYGAMLPQPFLRFLLADEPGTGKTIMAGLYIREMQRLGLLKRVLVVVPANLASKWQADFDRFFGGGLRRVTAETVREHALDLNHDLWVVSLELAAVNPNVQDALRPDRAGWDLVVFDEAHRLTPTATGYHQVGRLLAKAAPRALLMTATPHRGKEWLFRHLLHLVDPAIYPDPGDDPDTELTPLRPGPIHFLRRMKEDLVDYDGVTRLFRGRSAANHKVPLSSKEFGFYTEALDLVERFFPPNAQPLARMVYGKRAASGLHALAETLKRRVANMGAKSEAEAEMEADRDFYADEASVDEAKVVNASSMSAKAERREVKDLAGRIAQLLGDTSYEPSKWRRLIEDCLATNGIGPGNREQAVIFTEYADTAEWLTCRLQQAGFTARMYSGRQANAVRDEVRAAFMRSEFQIIVTTDAGNEGIDLQAAHVLVNYDIPWSLVRLEQRMGRIHRVGQHRDVYLYNLVAVDTREGETLYRLLENFVTAANELGGQMFDSLSAVAEITGIQYEQWLADIYGNDTLKAQRAQEAVAKLRVADLKRASQQTRATESLLATQVDAMAALTLLQRDLLARINPAIVDKYLTRLADAHVIGKQATALGDGIVLITREAAFPSPLGGGLGVLVATSGEALRISKDSVDVSNVQALGPGEAAFTALIGVADTELSADTYQTGAVSDPTSITSYDLYAYEATLCEGGLRDTAWAALIRVDDAGQSYPVRWETLANLVPTTDSGTSPHPARQDAASRTANDVAAATVSEHQRVRTEWFAQAQRDLQNLPTELTHIITDREQRVATRQRLQTQTTQRLDELQRLSQVTISSPRLAARVRVHSAAIPKTAEETDSELISMRAVQQHLTRDGWQVADIHTENRGYDLHAVRGRERRLVEVKGVWSSAASTGIRMTGNEILIATQHTNDYWLYVIDHCNNGTGQFFGAYSNPAQLFASDITGDAIFKVPGSRLNAARKIQDTTG